MALTYVTITGTFKDGSGAAISGTATFTPSETVYASGIPVASVSNPVQVAINGGTLAACQLLATDNAGLSFEGLTGFFYWTVTVQLGGVSQQSWSFFLPSSPSTVDLYALASTGAGGQFTGGTLGKYLAPAVVPLTFGASIPVNAALGNDFRVTLTASTGTIANPTNPVDGQIIEFQIAQDATGSRTVAWGTAYDFGTAGAPTLSTTASKVDIVGFKYNATLGKWLCVGSALGF